MIARYPIFIPFALCMSTSYYFHSRQFLNKINKLPKYPLKQNDLFTLTSKMTQIPFGIQTDYYSAGLMDMGYIGSKHTWSNRVNGKGHRRARIDFALQNFNWVRDYSSSKVLHLPFLGSDHCPLLLITESN